jgi:hypothetical protein
MDTDFAIPLPKVLPSGLGKRVANNAAIDCNLRERRQVARYCRA